MTSFMRIDDNDDVIVALQDFHKGDIVDGLTLKSDVKMGHKIALHDMTKGHAVIKYGNIIGILSQDVKKGEWIHSHNLMTSLASLSPTYSYQKHLVSLPSPSKAKWNGYLRSNGAAGTRDDIFLIPTVGCVNGSCHLMAASFYAKHPDADGRVKVLTHPYGCSQLGDDLKMTQRTLAGLAKNPNAGAVLVVGLGCENNRLSSFLPLVGQVDPQRFLSFAAQEVNDDVAYGAQCLEKLWGVIKKDQRVSLPLSYLSIGLKCGGSDGLSGLSANPLVGLVSDLVGVSGGKVALTEVPEMFGAEQELMARAKDKATFDRIVALIQNFKAYYAKAGQPCYENPSPGNKDGGITTLEEKSNGCILKGGHLEIRDVLEMGDPLCEKQLSLVDAPGNDLVASTALVSCGVNMILFTTGRGTPFGSIVPTVKIATNHRLAAQKPNWIDYDGERAFDIGFIKARDELLALILRIASGEEAKEEKGSMSQIAIFKTGVTL